MALSRPTCFPVFGRCTCVYAALRTPTSPWEGTLWCPAEHHHRVPGCVRRGRPCAPLGVFSRVPAGASLMDTKKDDSKGQAPRRTAQLVRGKREPPLPHGCPGCPPAPGPMYQVSPSALTTASDPRSVPLLCQLEGPRGQEPPETNARLCSCPEADTDSQSGGCVFSTPQRATF